MNMDSRELQKLQLTFSLLVPTFAHHASPPPPPPTNFSSSPPSLQQHICYVKVYVCVKKSETIILMRNLFRINLARNMAYIYSYSSLRYSRVTQEIPTRKYFELTKYLRNTFGPTKTRWHDATRPTRTTMARDQQNGAHS